MTTARWLSPEQRPDDRQRESVRDELHDLIDQCVDAWPKVIKQAREMGRGYPATSSGAGAGGPSHGDGYTPRSGGPDPAARARDWLTEWAETIAHLRNTAGHSTRVLPANPATVERGRVNTVEVCSECGRPVITGKRLDGDLLHNESPGTDDHGQPLPVCWWARYNRGRGRREA